MVVVIENDTVELYYVFIMFVIIAPSWKVLIYWFLDTFKVLKLDFLYWDSPRKQC